MVVVIKVGEAIVAEAVGVIKEEAELLVPEVITVLVEAAILVAADLEAQAGLMAETEAVPLLVGAEILVVENLLIVVVVVPVILGEVLVARLAGNLKE